MEALRQRVMELLDYDPDTGVFTRKVSRGNVRAGSVAGSHHPQGYLRIAIDGKNHKAHRLAYLIVHGFTPNAIDHINGNPADNRIDNLREATIQENNRNTGKRVTNSSGYKGVYWKKQSQKWMAYITVTRKNIHLGYFTNPEEASAAYEAAAKKHFGEFYRPKHAILQPCA